MATFADSMEISVSRKAHFNAAHRLQVKEWSEEENRAFFGACNNPNFHGHNYDLIVTLRGKTDPVTGYLIDMKQVAEIIREEVEERFDHKNLNLDCPEFAQLNPTTENLAGVIWRLLRNRFSDTLHLKITLYETDRNFVEYEGK